MIQPKARFVKRAFFFEQNEMLLKSHTKRQD